MTRPVIETADLSKSYRGCEAVRQLSLSIGAGRITAFLGPNGAGKSTTIKMLLGMTRPDDGTAAVLGASVGDRAASLAVRRRIAYVAENKALYDYMTVAQIIHFTRGFYEDWQTHAEQKLLREYALPAGRKIRKLSKGMRTKLATLLALARRPELMILDEPTDGLDPIGIEQLLEGVVRKCADGVSVFFSSHQIAEVERIADDVCILNHGRLAAALSLDDLRQSWRRIDMTFPAAPANHLFSMPEVHSIRRLGSQVSVLASGNSEELIARARAFEATQIDVSPVGLREVFLDKVREN